VDVNERDNQGYTSLLRAARSNKPDCVELLLQHGAGVNDKVVEEFASIHYAAFHDHKEIVDILIKVIIAIVTS
jgi:ankyrin repeat protein